VHRSQIVVVAVLRALDLAVMPEIAREPASGPAKPEAAPGTSRSTHVVLTGDASIAG